MEGVITLLSYATYKKFKVAFFNGILEEGVYIEQHKGFVEPRKKDMACKLKKAFYGLKLSSIAWYERLHSYLIEIGFSITSKNSNFCLKNEAQYMVLIAEIFSNDKIFGGNDMLSHFLIK